MRNKLFVLIVWLCASPLMLLAQKSAKVTSPDGKVIIEVTLTAGSPVYKVSYKKQAVINSSPLTLDFDSGAWGKNLKMSNVNYSKADGYYDLVVGKAKHIRNNYREAIIPFEETQKPFRKINLVARAYNDGVAFRYMFPKQAGWKNYTLYDEHTNFNLAGDPKALVLFLPSYTSSHEGPYTHEPYSKLKVDSLMDMPATFEYSNNIYLAITEAEVVDYAGMYLSKNSDGTMRGKLSPLPGQDKEKVKAVLPHETPWRVAIIGDRAGALIESNMLTNLNGDCKIEDTSWIKPGKATFPWWNGSVVPDTVFAPGNNFETNKYYIDFCARNNIQYHSVVEYGLHEWYVNDGPDFFPGPNADPSKAVSSLDMQKICDYAKSKGVGIRVWVHWKPLYPILEKAFAQYEKWGISGMMVDFMDRDDQEMIKIQEDILQTAAKHHLHIQFHGSSKPSGLHRMYPNEFTREGTRNYEVYKWDTTINASHDIAMPFTRMLAGATDYHLGGFRAVPQSKFKVRFRNPLVTSTRCHMMAMYVVLESYLGMVCDAPQAYEGQPGFDFLQTVPTNWDETRVPNAAINQYVTIARRNGNNWFIGAITDNQPRNHAVKLDFLGDGEYTADIYTDAADTDTNPNNLKKETKTVTRKDVLNLPVAANGGAVVKITKK
ncbi:glycoside hydrolase family 97 protein [Mucilaginibacter conchicola]|uniref:Glycoside hydrolase family 97 protein n=1 Tax=Mucilaginibacter conchicola TaxID=2303333 RepID=A0A372NMB0_9SPHI|nr:glycoside hydrolase family 97 protein [Mucilaginibacter conchicola]RFZ89988.1 glycoside hydrolase family 97 protein [Mucilaginibacter conchicola]